MAVLVSAYRLKKAFAARPLFDGLTFSIENGERIGLIGPNGAGKSTLLRILASRDTPDSGELSLQRGLKVGYLEQVPSVNEKGTVFDVVMEGVADPDDWSSAGLAHELISRLELDALHEGSATIVGTLSGGWKKRVALARELARSPDLLLLDEPTNHLDVDSILWLEEFIAQSRLATLTITHDRAFLQNIANRIIELDRKHVGGLLSVQGTYADYLETRDQLLSAQLNQEERLKNTLRRETEWLRRGAKARTTKQQARIQRHGELSEAVGELEYRNRERSTRIEFDSGDKAPKKLLEAKKISQNLGGKTLFTDLDVVIRPATRLGLLGPNGCGKSTLIRTLLGELKPTAGEVKASEHLKVAYFEQNRETLDPHLTLSRTLCPKGDFVDYRGGRVHIRGYLDRFMFTPEQAEMRVGKLSGGEQSRVLIARLMLKEANLLVLDEPTNDLDIATLTVLADCLEDFSGAVILVTHDRYFLDQVSTQLLAFDVKTDNPKERLLPFADLDQWESWRRSQSQASKSPTTTSGSNPSSTPAAGQKRKLTFKEQREWESLEPKIHALEAEIELLNTKTLDATIATHAIELRKVTDLLSARQQDLEKLLARWEVLGALVS